MRHSPFRRARSVVAMMAAIALCACDPESKYIDEESALAIVAPDDGDGAAAAQRALGLAAALRELAAVRGNEPSWTAETEIADAFPLFLPGREAPSYYELKVTTGREDAGYIVVNVDRTDLLVVETAVAGRTLTEAYSDATGRTDLEIVRYDWFASSARHGREIVAAVGLDGTAEVRLVEGNPALAEAVAELDARSARYVEEHACAPTQSRRALDAWYGGSRIAELEITEEELLDGDFVDYLNETVPITSSWVYHYLDHHFSSPTWHLPHWAQPHDADGYPVGCGPVAWAMVYAYWQEFHGKSGLFDAADLSGAWEPEDCDPYDGNEINEAMWELAELVETVYGGSKSKWGMTYPWNMDQGAAYAMLHGYLFTTCDEDSGTEWSKFQTIDDEIVADRPAILRINAEGVGSGDHYVAIEGTRYREEVGLDSLGYRANFGWAGKSSPVWIYVQSAPDGGEYHSAFNAYSVDM